MRVRANRYGVQIVVRGAHGGYGTFPLFARSGASSTR
jgi:hypothetical protein